MGPELWCVDGIGAALWSGPVTYFFKGTQYIRVTRTSDSDLSGVDEGYPQPISNWNFPGTFGVHGIKGALYSGSVCYFFDGANYIRVHRGLEGAGYVDTGHPRATKDVWGRPDGFGANGIDAALYSGGPLVPQPTPGPGNNGNNNYFLWDNGNPLLGVQATVNIDEAFISTNQGFSFHLNRWSQEGAISFRTGSSSSSGTPKVAQYSEQTLTFSSLRMKMTTNTRSFASKIVSPPCQYQLR
jgi:hypothetical protein